MRLPFTKMHGAGNDYIYVDAFAYDLKDPAEFALHMSDRHKGIGSDGLVLIGPSKTCDVRMRMFNADGSEGRMCGNASRCVGKYAYEHGICRKESMTMETLAGVKVLHLTTENDVVTSVTVDMGQPLLHPADIPMAVQGDSFIDGEIECAGRTWRGTAVCTGPAHLVIFTDIPVDELDFPVIGPQFENHPLFPDRVNTDFVNEIGNGVFQMRVWERGRRGDAGLRHRRVGRGGCGGADGACPQGPGAVRAPEGGRPLCHLAWGRRRFHAGRRRGGLSRRRRSGRRGRKALTQCTIRPAPVSGAGRIAE